MKAVIWPKSSFDKIYNPKEYISLSRREDLMWRTFTEVINNYDFLPFMSQDYNHYRELEVFAKTRVKEQ